jgi:DNA repair exonuclease SbcCD nuclease subunit
MPRLLHAADLHLCGDDKEYGLSVFADLIGTAQRERADYLLFCGDLFDTYADAEGLKGEVRNLLGAPPFEFLYLPGNHEGIRRGGGDLSRLDLGAATVLQTAPWGFFRRERGGVPVEFLAVPHQESYAGYGSWQVPPKETRWRVALAHGLVAGMAYRGPDDEGGASALDPDLFQRFRVDYAALGHIHGGRKQGIGSVLFAYPGSSRVWRRNESGARGAWLVDLPAEGPLPAPAFVPLAAAGEFRHYALPLSLEGEPPDLDSLAKGWGPADFIVLSFTGIVEDENAVAALADRLRARYAGRVRRLEIERDEIASLPGIADQPLVRRFLEAWEKRVPAADAPGSGELRAEWLRARELALAALKAGLERTA